MTHDPSQPLPVLRSQVSTRSETYVANHEAMTRALGLLAKHLRRARSGGGVMYVARHIDRGKLLPRERVERLLDRDSHFLELCPLAGKDMQGCKPGAGMISGIGVVSGVEVAISANDSTQQGGAINEWGVKKMQRLSVIALENRLPGVSLIESAGADLPNQANIFVPGGRGFHDLTVRSRHRIPTICLVFGSSTAGGAYLPGMSDYAVMVKEQAQVFLAGPPLVKMAIGEEVDDETLGGADMHARTSGLADYLAQDELDAIRIGREIVAAIGWDKQGPGPSPGVPEPPRFDPTELRGIAAMDVKQPIPAREIIARVVDGSRFLEFKPLYGPTLVTGFASIHGFRVGILANEGILMPASAEKGAQFIALCNQRNIPLVFLQNTTGFMVGKDVEQAGIIRAGAKLINAVSNSTVPALTVMTGASFGAGNYAMCGRAYGPRFVFTWPNHRIAVMGGEQLAGVLDIIKRQSAARKGVEVDEENLSMMKQMIQGKIDMESTADFATARVWDDGIIDPADTRDVLGIALSACHSAPVEGTTAWGVFRH
ncbi:MAG: carboxyl transferase domain-containing protein [Myxococcota bacterium]|nr:carboxyl transferase domain-containing protein [Myxococcota bacterium]